MMDRRVLVLGAALALANCAGLPMACPPGQQPMMSVELLFGRKIGERVAVSDAEFARFVDAEITPRFPDGLSVVDAKGQWRDRDRDRTVREPSKIVTLIHDGSPARIEAVAMIAAAYKRRFNQQSVGIVSRPVCAGF